MAGELIYTSLSYIMKEKKHTYLAVDVAKATLQIQTRENARALPYDRRGIEEIILEARKDPNTVVVLEATGGFERDLLDALHSASVACVLVNPGRVRAFARSEGIKAKTDPIDARVLLRFAQEKALQPMPVPSTKQKELAALLDRRTQLNAMLIEEKTRLQNTPKCIQDDIRGLIRSLKLKIQRIEQRIENLIRADESMQEAAKLIQSVEGVGPVTAWAILAYLPEITQLSRNQICALVGIAPFNRDSGKKSGPRCIHGGRVKVRNTLYMAAVSASMHNPIIRDYVRGLRERGKAFKCAIVAAMRKLILHIQSLLKKHAFAA
jgi:transposase